MRHLLYTIKRSDVIESINTWRETSVEAENLVVDKGSEGKVIEEICEVFPNVCVAVLPETFVVEAIDLRDLTGFVVAAKDCNALGVSDL